MGLWRYSSSQRIKREEHECLAGQYKMGNSCHQKRAQQLSWSLWSIPCKTLVRHCRCLGKGLQVWPPDSGHWTPSERHHWRQEKSQTLLYWTCWGSSSRHRCTLLSRWWSGKWRHSCYESRQRRRRHSDSGWSNRLIQWLLAPETWNPAITDCNRVSQYFLQAQAIRVYLHSRS